MKNNQEIVIKGIYTVSTLGENLEKLYSANPLNSENIRAITINNQPYPGYFLPETLHQKILSECSTRKSSKLDPTTKMAIYCAKNLLSQIELSKNNKNYLGVSIGSARGSTNNIESSIDMFLREGKIVDPETSPITTAGNIASFVAQAIGATAGEFSTSMTCTSSFHALAIGYAFLKSGLANHWLAGGSEAPLTPYTIAQMVAMRTYGVLTAHKYPCKPFYDATEKRNSLVLGEGCGTILLEIKDKATQNEIKLFSIGLAIEESPSFSGINKEGKALAEAMKHALSLANLNSSEIDCIVMHAPGTLAGDQAELAAINYIFGSDLPKLCSTKFFTGHTFGASGMLSLDLGIKLINGFQWPGFPYRTTLPATHNKKESSKVMINTAGFGGNAISIIVGK